MFDLFFIILPICIGLIIGYIFKPSEDWNSKNKSKYIPPAYVFSIVWSILYLLLGLLIYRKYNDYVIFSIIIVNLCFNFAYTPIQFRLNNERLAFIVLIFTLLSACYLYIELLKRNYLYDSILVVPYIIWLVIALGLSIMPKKI